MRNPITLVVAATLLCLCINSTLLAQAPNPIEKFEQLPVRYIGKVEAKFDQLNTLLSRKTERYLRQMARQEHRLQLALSKLDAGSHQAVGECEAFYGKLAAKMNEGTKNSKVSLAGEYLPYVDSVQTSLAFLQQNSQLQHHSMAIEQKLQGSLAQVKQFQSRLQQTEKIKQQLSQRKEQIKQRLLAYKRLPPALSSAYRDYNKQLYYYSTQLKEYRNIANDPDRLTKKALAILRQSKTFAQFAQKYSQLAGLFNMPTSYGDPGNLSGLQTKKQVFDIVQQHINASGPNGAQMLTQQLQAAQAQLTHIKNKLHTMGRGSGDIDLPDFKPNSQKTKSFWKRLEYGTNLQTSKYNFFPTTTDFGFSLGYRINDKSTTGVGVSYKLGLGKDIKHIAISHQGIGLRSFVDIKLKGSFYLTGGLEYNYQPMRQDTVLPSPLHFPAVSSWHQSGLVGVSKIVSVNTKFFKKTKIQLLWDFLSYQQLPKRQPVKFRVGYNF